MADALSRSSGDVDHEEVRLNEEMVVNAAHKVQLQKQNRYEDYLVKLVSIVKNNTWDESHKEKYKAYYASRNKLTEHQGLLYYNRCRYVPAFAERPDIIDAAHHAHQGIVKTQLRIAEYFWWPGWNSQVYEFIKDCKICKSSPRTKKTWEEPLNPVTLPKGPWQKVAIDIKGPIKGGTYPYLLVLMDYYSKWPEVIGLYSITSKVIINVLIGIFARCGVPRELVSDNGRQFISEEMKMFLEKLQVRHRTVALYSPKQNGLVERFNRFLAEKLAEARLNKQNTKRAIEIALYNYRSTPHITTRVSPFEAFYNRKMPNQVARFFPQSGFPKQRKIDGRDLAERQSRMKTHHDKKFGAKSRRFQKGQTIFIKKDKGVYYKDKVKSDRRTSILTKDNGVWPKNKISK